MGSLVTRVLVAAGVVLVVFLGLTVAALDIAFRSAAERAARDRLQVQVFALMSAAEFPDENGLVMSDALAEPRYSHPGSGLYAQVSDDGERILWRSPSAVGLTLSVDESLPGQQVFGRRLLTDGTEVFQYGMTVLWEAVEEGKAPTVYRFAIAEGMESFHAQVSRFRANLLWWFGLVFAALIIAQLFILRRTLRPLRDLASEVGRIEAGSQAFVEELYPRELSRLARNLNALIRNERAHLERYRNTLGDLAHSLKTPLAVIRVALEDRGNMERDATIGSQVDRMNEIVRHQLQKARLASKGTFGQAVVARAVVDDIIGSLRKVYTGHALVFQVDIAPESVFRGSREDFLEVVGNLLDNACKWAREVVRIVASPLGERGLLMVVEDDGPGIPEAERAVVLMRGTRVDESVDGHGIGLAMVRDIVRQHGGTMALGESVLGGLKVTVEFCDNPSA